MSEIQNSKRYDLEDRTLEFGKRIIRLAKALPKNTINFKLTDQIVRSGTSAGANYREAFVICATIKHNFKINQQTFLE